MLPLGKVKSEDANKPGNYQSGNYWEARSDLIYYRYVDYVVRVLGAEASSLIDVGTGNCPYLEWFPWIGRRVSIDISSPYVSNNVEGIEANVLNYQFKERFDLCLCLQVLEHVPDPISFSRRLLEIADLVVITVPFQWPEGQTKGHLNDPVDLKKLTKWVGRSPNFSTVIAEPFRFKKHERLLAIYDVNLPKRKFGRQDIENRRLPKSWP
ncbi:class I SAM-dependent methyltransferase [Ruegeria arenilitoris]|uniref:class I SAM-dependent methyltransferase n=1 Tax=Ruegeria arenilitoris TaxID=1173585 RepID=UPI00147D5930|nr:methyltransferase domain-containing protein [Ruegeria arenilitoris]